MKRISILFLSIAAIAMLTSYAMSQQQDRRGGRGRVEGRPDGPPPNRIAETLDVDGNHELSQSEIENAATALKKLDQNKDGKITEDELHPFGGRRGGERGRPGPDGPPDRRRDDRGAGGPERNDRNRGQGENAGSYLDRLRSFDKNKDGKITKSELPERMHGILNRLDENEDGTLDAKELEQVAARFGRDNDRQPEGRRGRGDDRRQGREGPGGPRDGHEGRGGPGGPPSPDRLVEHAMEFDADKNGKLSKAELLKFAEEVIRHRGPGRGPEGRDGRGGRGPRGEGRPGDRRRPDSNGRPQRPASD